MLTQLACRLEKTRPVPASAFRPRPRVESSFVTFVRREAEGAGAAVEAGGSEASGAAVEAGGSEASGAGRTAVAGNSGRRTEEYAAVSHLVRLAFGQRRKTLGNSLGGAAHAGVTLGARRRARGAARARARGGGAAGGAHAAAVAHVRRALGRREADA